jgi:hypothetical protein
MTLLTTNRPDPEMARETCTPVRLPEQMSTALFPGWGPKF